MFHSCMKGGIRQLYTTVIFSLIFDSVLMQEVMSTLSLFQFVSLNRWMPSITQHKGMFPFLTVLYSLFLAMMVYIHLFSLLLVQAYRRQNRGGDVSSSDDLNEVFLPFPQVCHYKY